jgi:hypothetical protein
VEVEVPMRTHESIVMRVCDGTCGAGYSDCSGNLQSDGCETATGADVQDCGRLRRHLLAATWRARVLGWGSGDQALTGWAEGHGGSVLGSGYKVRVSERRGVMPDVQVFRRGNEPAVDQEQGLARGHPDLVVGIVSPSSLRYDRVTKLRWYAQLGVPEYWIVDPSARTLERLVLREGIYGIAESLADEDVLRPESFEGLELPLAKLWD